MNALPTVLKVLLALAVALAALAWLTHRPLPPHAGPTAAAPAIAAGDTTLGRALAAEVESHPGLTGIHPLPGGHDAFVARAALADAAERRIDAQYYIWHDDTAGRLLLQALRRAADRGVAVRLLLDDNNTGGMDPVLLALDAHPRIEVRVFNPLLHRQARLLDYLSDFFRVNRRMHNKSFTVDDQASVVGGRNVGDEYFGAGAGVMFADLDVLAVGAAVPHVVADFERYWGSASTYPLARIAPDETGRSDVGTPPAADAATQGYLKTLAGSDLLRQLRAASLSLQWAPARLVSDDPAKALGQASAAQTVLGQLDQVLAGARTQLTIVSPYFVPTQAGTDVLTGLARRGAAVTVLTNALAATDVAAVHAGYAKYREALLRGGVRLHELKPGATVIASGQGGFSGSSGASLHAKTFEVDGRQLFVGSFNMDPRSAALNTEMGLLIDSPVLARQLTEALAAHGAANSYAVALDGGALRWTTQEAGRRVTYDEEPGASWLRRASVRVLAWLPIEWLL